FPQELSYQRNLAASKVNHAGALRQSGRLEEAENACGQAISILQELRRQHPNWPEVRLELAEAYGVVLGPIAALRWHRDEEERAYAEAIRLLDDFPALLQENPSVVHRRAQIHVNRSYLMNHTGRSKEGEESLKQALEILLTKCLKNRSESPDLRADLVR